MGSPPLERCLVLQEDPDLAEGLPASVSDRAIEECVASTISLPAGRWKATELTLTGESVGLLVLGGLLARRVGVDARFGAELLGEGDLLRPWQGEDEPATLAHTTGWTVLSGTRVAVLDEAFAACVACYPSIIGRLVARALQRSRNLAINMAIVHQARVDVRLHMLLWHLAGRWGRVTSGGVILPMRLTHSVLAELAAARRPTVSSALAELARNGLARPVDGGWLLLGRPPGELLELEPVLPRLRPTS
jgi:CRP-like cAMP-binding protein